VGAGAVGLFYGSRLHQPENNVLVSLVCRSNYNAIKANGVKLETHSFGNYTFHPENAFNSVQQASDFLQATGSNGKQASHWDYVVVATKALPTSTASNSEANLVRPVVSEGTTIVLIQNGIGIEKPYADVFPGNALLSAVTVVSAEQLEKGFVRQNRWTRISLGPWDSAGSKQGDERTRAFAEIMKSGGVKDAEMYDERGLQFVRWHKIAVRAIIRYFLPTHVPSDRSTPPSTHLLFCQMVPQTVVWPQTLN
jgi:2-dehydropantoate 2-reductase